MSLIPHDLAEPLERWLHRRRLYGRLAERCALNPCEGSLVDTVAGNIAKQESDQMWARFG